MTRRPTRPSRSPRPAGDTRRLATYHPDEPASRNSWEYVVILLLLMALVVLCIAGFVVVRTFLSDSSLAILPAPGSQTPSPALTDPGPSPLPPGTGPDQARITIEPGQGYIGTLVAVTGQGWWPGEPVFVFLRSPEESDATRYAYAAAVADEQGSFRSAFTFPNEVRWLGKERADVIARGTRSGFQISAPFTLVPPTPTSTSPPATPLPTSLPTHTPMPTGTPLPTPTLTPEVITDWRGEYFANPALAGEPAFIRNDVAIDFYWGMDSPGAGMPADTFSIRWTRPQYFSEGVYLFTVTVDDGARFWVDGQLFVDDWQNGPLRSHAFDLYLPEGEHALHLEYYENLGDAGVRLAWEQVELPTPTLTLTTRPPEDTATPTPEATDTPVPTQTLLPPPSDAWQAQYFANPLLGGEPVLVREDPGIDFDWGAGSPDDVVPPDNFSARWTREVQVPAGRYRFLLDADDGARLWIDGQLLIDAWHLSTGETYAAEIDLPEGMHTLRVEYFEAFLDARIRLRGEKAP